MGDFGLLGIFKNLLMPHHHVGAVVRQELAGSAARHVWQHNIRLGLNACDGVSLDEATPIGFDVSDARKCVIMRHPQFDGMVAPALFRFLKDEGYSSTTLVKVADTLEIRIGFADFAAFCDKNRVRLPDSCSVIPAGMIG